MTGALIRQFQCLRFSGFPPTLRCALYKFTYLLTYTKIWYIIK